MGIKSQWILLLKQPCQRQQPTDQLCAQSNMESTLQHDLFSILKWGTRVQQGSDIK